MIQLYIDHVSLEIRLTKMISAKVISNTKGSINLTKTPYAALAKMVPPVLNNTLIFQLKNANCAIANAIRRTLISEIPIKHLTVSLVDIKTTDPYIVGEVIKKRIEMIPISQSIKDDLVFSLRVENETDTYIDVSTTEMKLNGVNQTKDITPAIPICDINSGTSFAVNDIHVVESYGFDNARTSIGKVGYEIINHDMTQPSNNSTPTEFRLEIETAGLIDPKQMVVKAIDGLMKRLEDIDYSRAITEFDVYKLPIHNETHTIGRLMSWYIYKTLPSVKYVASRIHHPSQRECIIDIHHPDGEALCKKAVESIKAELAAIRKEFK